MAAGLLLIAVGLFIGYLLVQQTERGEYSTQHYHLFPEGLIT